MQIPINPIPELPLTVFHAGDLDRVRRVYLQLGDLDEIEVPWWAFRARRRHRNTRAETMMLLGECIATAIASNPAK